jgi:hypothetical protein
MLILGAVEERDTDLNGAAVVCRLKPELASIVRDIMFSPSSVQKRSPASSVPLAVVA